MVPYLLYFHENIRLVSKTLGEYHEQRYSLEKATISFLHRYKKCVQHS